MRGSSTQVQTVHVPAAVGWLERTSESAVACYAVNSAIQHAVTIVNILRRQSFFGYDLLFDVFEARCRAELVENYTPIPGKHFLPVVVRPQVRRVNQDIQRFAALGRDRR